MSNLTPKAEMIRARSWKSRYDGDYTEYELISPAPMTPTDVRNFAAAQLGIAVSDETAAWHEQRVQSISNAGNCWLVLVKQPYTD